MAVSRFEELLVWQKAKALSLGVYHATGKGAFARDFGLRDQMQRASVSVMSNIAEGFERRSSAEFARFLAISRGSVAEVRSQLYLARELDYIEETEFRALVSLTREITGMIVILRKSIGA